MATRTRLRISRTRAAAKKKTTTRGAPRPRTAKTTRPGARKDFGSNPSAYFAKLQPPVRKWARLLRRIVRNAAPKAEESIKWGRPVYSQNGLLCFIHARPTYVAFGFFGQGKNLVDPHRRLKGQGKAGRHVKIRSLADIRAGRFRSWVRKAIQLNARKASAGRRAAA